MSCYPKYRVIVYHQEGEERGNREFVLECLSLEDARERREFYKTESKDPSLYPVIQMFRESKLRPGNYGWFYLEG